MQPTIRLNHNLLAVESEHTVHAMVVTSVRYWRELYVAAPVGEVAIEGYIDLLYETDDGLVIVDYKTDAIGTDAAMADKVDRYARQLAGYAIALETATGLTVSAAAGSRLLYEVPTI